MQLPGFLKRTLFGIELPQEYICVPFELENTPTMHLNDEGPDIASKLLFLGYKPVLFGCENDMGPEVHISIRQNGEKFADLSLRSIESKNGLWIYVATSAKATLASSWNRFWREARESLKNKGEKNINLDRTLYAQVVTAYSLPRKISLAVVEENGLINDFPTDLHGPLGEAKYCSSLRSDGKACAQVERLGSLTLYDMPLEGYREVYAKGPNHNKELRRPGPNQLNSMAVARRRLKVTGKMESGIHTLFQYEVLEEEKFETDKPGLAHCHRAYIQWRIKKGIPTEYSLR